MFSLLNKITFIVALVSFIFTIQCSASSPLENDKLAQLVDQLDRMQTKMDAMQTKMDGMQTKMDAMQTKMDAMRSREEVLEAENAKLTERLDGIRIRVEGLEVENDKWTRKFGNLEADNEKLKSQISHPKFSLSPIRDDWQSPKVLSSPPTSCQELKDRSWKIWPMDGIHLLKKQNKIQAAFCIFPADGSPVSEALIGQVNVKTKIVHFYVQKNSNFGGFDAVIPFELARLNEGGAFDLASGTFTVPVPGIYHFEFSALKDASSRYLVIHLLVNGVNVGEAWTSQSVTGNYDTVSLTASLRLAAGDKIKLYNWSNGVLYDTGFHYTHFTGRLVEEELK